MTVTLRVLRSEDETTYIYGKRGRGRPKTIEDMRAYKAEKAKQYRAIKAAKDAK